MENRITILNQEIKVDCLLIEIDKEFREKAICCDESWISRFPHEIIVHATFNSEGGSEFTDIDW